MNAKIIDAIQTATLRLTNAPRKQGFSLLPKDGGAIHHYTAPDGAISSPDRPARASLPIDR